MTLRTLLLAGLCLALPASAAAPAYNITSSVALGGADKWDYVLFDSHPARIYVAHGPEVSVVDAATGKLAGTIAVGGATHGIAIVPTLGKGYTDDSQSGTVLVFDLKTLKPLKRIKAEPDADGIAYDRHSGHVLVIDGDSAKVTVIDPKTDTVVAAIDGGGGLEFGVSDEAGKFYVDGADKNEIVRMDLAGNIADAHWPMPGCKTPHGLAIDRAHMRLFASCGNKVMIVLDAHDGRVLATLPIGAGTDFAMFDPVRNLAFSSNRDGTLSLIAEKTPDSFAIVSQTATAPGARTMGLDPATGRIYLATADMDIDPSAASDDLRHRFHVKPGSAKLLVLEPASQ